MYRLRGTIVLMTALTGVPARAADAVKFGDAASEGAHAVAADNALRGRAVWANPSAVSGRAAAWRSTSPATPTGKITSP